MRMVVALVAGLAACVPAERVSAPGEPPPPLAGGAPLPGVPILPTFYDAEPLTHLLEDPRAVVFDASGTPHVLEGAPARLSRVLADGALAPVATGGGNGAWTGAARIGDTFYVAEEGGDDLPGRILAIGLDSAVRVLPVALPPGAAGPMTAGPDGALYLGLGPPRDGRPIPCQDVTLAGGGRVEGRVPCTGSVLRVTADGSDMSVHSWGYANPSDLAFTPDGRLLVADDLAPVTEAGVLFSAVPGVWYGTVQAAGLDPSAMPNPPPPPVAEIEGGVKAASVPGNGGFGGPGHAFLARPGEVAFADIRTGTVVPFAANLERPTALAFSPDALLVADAGTGTLWRIVEMPR